MGPTNKTAQTKDKDKDKDKDKKYLTIHGHFYQPPRENPWLEAIEQQDSALPFHDWNERVNLECYNPNSASRIVDDKNKVLDIVNNYSLMSYNFGPTLLSWMETHAPKTYERIIRADVVSRVKFSGHGNAIAQVYNHMIMPLANRRDKETQVKWGIRDFEYRFGRMPEGMWLAETAVDDETLEVLADNGIKFTILSPYQALKYRKLGDKEWTDAGWGNIDPAKPYRYFIKDNPKKFVDLFFYDGAISKSVAFDNILQDGNKFVNRLKEGISSDRNYPQLIHIGTDGESYGHHTKFGDMTLAYVLRVKAEQEGFTITNYAEYLEKYGVNDEVDIKQASSWSCFHGVGRWKEDCGCSTGGQPSWNQRWRKPLREALDYLRDNLIVLYEKYGKKFFTRNVWDVRNDYINVILNRSELSIRTFLKNNLKPECDDDDKVAAMKLLEMQRQAMLMYTSCGWFFADISGIETTQIMKYAARAMQPAKSFTEQDYETEFVNILANAQSNIKEFGSGADIYRKFVKPSVVTIKQIVSLWAISSLYEEIEDEATFYCYDLKRLSYKMVSKGKNSLYLGRVEVRSQITLEKYDMIFALLKYSGGDFHCTIKEFASAEESDDIRKNLTDTFINYPLTEIIRSLDKNFGSEYYTLKDIFIEERRKILNIMIQGKTNKFSGLYKDIYEDGKASIFHFKNLGLNPPDEFKIAAKYVLGIEFNKQFEGFAKAVNDHEMQEAIDINNEAKMLGVTLDKKLANNVFTEKITDAMYALAKNPEIHTIEAVLNLFKYVEALELRIDTSESQNTYFNKIQEILKDVVENIDDLKDDYDRKFVLLLLELGNKLNINTDFYKETFDKAMSPLTAAMKEIKDAKKN